MICIIFIIIMLSIVAIYNKLSKERIKYRGELYSILKNDGLGNRIAGIPGAFVLSLISKRNYFSIYYSINR